MSAPIKAFDWTGLVDAARARIAAAPRDKNAALEILSQSVVALRDLLHHELMPDPERKEYLRAVLSALELIVDGNDPTTVLHLSQGHRIRDERLWGRGLALFIDMGREVDRLRSRGDTRGDKPVQAAQQSVAKQWSLSLDTVKKAWHSHGSEDGWSQLRPVVDGKVNEK